MTAREHGGWTVSPVEVLADAGPAARPAFDVVEGKDGLTIHLDVPGADPRKIEVCAEAGNVLAISAAAAARKRAGEIFRQFELRDFHCRFRLGPLFDAAVHSYLASEGTMIIHFPIRK
jgi:HSP20 family molecular chaperone IbpA